MEPSRLPHLLRRKTARQWTHTLVLGPGPLPILASGTGGTSVAFQILSILTAILRGQPWNVPPLDPGAPLKALLRSVC